MHKLKYHSIGFLCIALTITSCMVGGKYQRPEGVIPPNKDSVRAADTSALVKWVDFFGDTTLTGMVNLALANNRNLMVAAARIDEARETAEIVRANALPSVGYQINAGVGSAETQALKLGSLNSGLFRVMGLLNWEIDIWGKLKRSTQAARAQVLALESNRNALQVSLIAEMASLYFLLRDLDNRLLIAERTLVSRKESTRIITLRFEKGYIAEIDQLQALQQEAIAAALIPNLKRQIVQTENALNVLMGRHPQPIRRGASLFEQELKTDIPEGIPSQLLWRRPDLIAAENTYRAQFERIGVAEANRYPSFSLTGLLGLASPQLSNLLSGGFNTNAVAGLTGPIFQFNQNKRRVEVERQKAKQAQLQYEQAMLLALADVNNALIQRDTYLQEYERRKEQTTAGRKALTLIRARYDYGYTSYLEVLVQESNLFEAELQESFLMQQRLNAYVSLYRALGGGW